jgi:large subunit ribosomal protein L25
MVEQFNAIKADIRTILGSAESRRLRKSGFLPATIRNGEDISYVAIDQKEFDKQYFAGAVFSSPIAIELDGKKIEITTKDVDTHPVSDRPIHADLVQINKDQAISVKSRLKFTGQDKSAALKRGGFLHINVRMVDIICKNIDNIPTEIEIDISKVPVGGKIKSDVISLSDDIRIKKKNNFLIASILGRGGAKSTESSSEESNENNENNES